MYQTIYAVYRYGCLDDEFGLALFDIRDVHLGTLGQIRGTCTGDALRRWIDASRM